MWPFIQKGWIPLIGTTGPLSQISEQFVMTELLKKIARNHRTSMHLLIGVAVGARGPCYIITLYLLISRSNLNPVSIRSVAPESVHTDAQKRKIDFTVIMEPSLLVLKF